MLTGRRAEKILIIAHANEIGVRIGLYTLDAGFEEGWAEAGIIRMDTAERDQCYLIGRVLDMDGVFEQFHAAGEPRRSNNSRSATIQAGGFECSRFTRITSSVMSPQLRQRVNVTMSDGQRSCTRQP